MMKTSTLRNDPEETSADENSLRQLEWWEIQQLEAQGCSADDWECVTVDRETDLKRIRNVDFEGSVSVGRINAERGGRLSRAVIRDSRIGSGVIIANVPGGIVNAVVRDDAEIRNTSRIEFEPEASCGVGVEVAVLDESGSRRVLIYPGISAQIAALIARTPQGADSPQWEHFVSDHLEQTTVPPEIGERAIIRDCGKILNVSVAPDCTIEGASRLENGALVNNATSGRAMTYVGHGVDAVNFIIEDGRVDSNAIIRNCYVGQGVEIEKGFTAHDTLFFANSSMENGEACAVFAGPYSVSMHKSTLLIGCMISFMNAGSATNQSNHMYKLGPVHWGLLERGVKTSSNSYLMLGAKIGAFSLLMGDHKTHPDSSEFPFSYLFGDDKGATVVVPGMMLRSCGLLRDEKKWPTRDRRARRRLPLHDRITFEVLNPHTVSHILRALETIAELLSRPADDDRFVRYKGMRFTRASLERAKMLYSLAIYKYLHTKLGDDTPFPEAPADMEKPWRWIDLAGQVVPAHLISGLSETNVREAESRLDAIFEQYADLERQWIGQAFGPYWRERRDRFAHEAARFDEMVEDDRTNYREQLNAENTMLRLL